MSGIILSQFSVPLSEVLKKWNDPLYERIYKIIAVEGRLPSPEEIGIIRDGFFNKWYDESVKGSAFFREYTIWFRDERPSYSVYAHELIHLAKPKENLDVFDEEVYAYNLTPIVLYIAKEMYGLPRRSPLRILDLTYSELNRIARGFLKRIGMTNVLEFLNFTGVSLSSLYTMLRLYYAESGRRINTEKRMMVEDPYAINELAERLERINRKKNLWIANYIFNEIVGGVEYNHLYRSLFEHILREVLFK